MFNRGGFNSSPYNRSAVTKITLGISISASGNMLLNLQPVFNLSGSFGGSSGINSELTALTNIKPDPIVGAGNLEVAYLVFFFLPLSISFTGTANFQMNNMGIQMPLDNVEFSGSGEITSNFHFLQNMIVDLKSTSALENIINLVTPLTDIRLSGGDYWNSPELRTLLPMVINVMSGEGNLKLRRLGAIDKILFELEEINLQPGQTIIIDTDLLNVFINNLLDVSSVTPESVFFELLPGETTITIGNSPGEPIEGDIVWQNRWL